MLTEAEQLAFFDAHAEEAWRDIISYIGRLKPQILAMARERLVRNFAAYGDESWHRDPEDLMREVMEELADAPAWEVMRLYAQEHSPLGRARLHYRVASIPDSPDD